MCLCECLHSFIRSLVTFMSAIWNIGVICSNLAIMWHAAAWGIPAIRIRSVGREREREGRMLLKQHTIIVNISLSFKCLHTQQRNNKNGSAAGTGGGMKPISRHYSYAA